MKNVLKTSRSSDVSLEELLSFERLLSDLSGRFAACIDRIAGATRRADQVINGIRAMFQKGNQEKTLLNVNQLIREVLELVSGEVQKKRVIVRSDLPDKIPAILANRVQLQQVMLNLITTGDFIAERVWHARLRLAKWAHQSKDHLE